ncbi:MAG: acetyl-CoA hydrolase/transferase C-terminal domain-containing protein [Dehalococcoidia bacterium]|nr:acetyl-CoA hydrolase/transferase family protein [Dehalococcoidia bacterium]
MQYVDAERALEEVRSGDRVYLHGGAATPQALVEALVRRAPELSGVEVTHLHTEAQAAYVAPEMRGHIRHNALFIGPNVRAAVQRGDADYTPVFLSEIPDLFAPGGALPLDVALIQVTPPDEHGHCSLGPSVDVAIAAAKYARTVIAQVNPALPRTLGASVRQEQIQFAVIQEAPVPEVEQPLPTPQSDAVGERVAGLIEDGATLQMGIGGIPNAVLARLTRHRRLGVHTEMFSDGLLPLIESGVVDGSAKTLHRGQTVCAFVIGSQRLYRFIHENPAVEFRPVSYTNNVDVIAAHDRMVAVNSALAVDLTGQVAADSIGPKFYSGIGGQVDFIRGAARSRSGVPIIALPSTAGGGRISRICASLPEAGGVVTTRGDVHWVVTEYGAYNLHGRTIRERARMLIDLAHPDFRAQLEEDAGRLGYFGR